MFYSDCKAETCFRHAAADAAAADRASALDQVFGRTQMLVRQRYCRWGLILGYQTRHFGAHADPASARSGIALTRFVGRLR